VTCCNIKHHPTSNLTFDGTINGLIRKQQNSVYRLCRFQLRSRNERGGPVADCRPRD
jgi:hypothetical protein